MYELCDLLRKRKFELGKSFRQLGELLSLRVTTVQRWHEGRGFPKPEHLALVAQVYEVDLSLLEAAVVRSKEQRKKERESRRNPRPKKYLPEEFSGIESTKILRSLNPDLRKAKYGRR